MSSLSRCHKISLTPHSHSDQFERNGEKNCISRFGLNGVMENATLKGFEATEVVLIGLGFASVR